MSMLAGTAAYETKGARSIPMLDRDALLQLSRRVDWRFLLPQPELSDVAYLGQPDPGLIESLQQFSSKLTLLAASPTDADLEHAFDLTVLHNPTFDELNRALRVTRTGGFIYVEVSRGRSRRQLPSSNGLQGLSVRRTLTEMRKLPLQELTVHWHWPTFEACTELIPLDNREAIICALRRRGSGTASRWKARLARVLLECHQLEKVVSCYSVLGQLGHLGHLGQKL